MIIHMWINIRAIILTYWNLDKMADILQTSFSDAISWMNNGTIWANSSLLLRVQMTMCQYWFRPQAITWTNDDRDQWR